MEETIAFETSAVFWHEVEDKAYEVSELSRLLGERMRLSDYGTGLQSIDFVPIAVQPSNKLHEEDISYDAEEARLSIYLKLDYGAVAAADKPTFLRLLAELFLRGLDEAPQDAVPGFDWAGFRGAVEAVFVEAGWRLR